MRRNYQGGIKRMSGPADEKNRLGIILAVIAGLLALGMTFVFLKKMKDTAGGQVQEQVSTVTKRILVATRDLPAGQVLSVNSDLQAVEMPAGSEMAAFAQSCVPASHAQELEGRTLGMPLAARSPLLFSNLVETYSLDQKFTEGYLKTVQLSRENLFGAHLSPGDRVDILATVPKKRESRTPAASAAPAANPAAPLDATGQAALLATLMESMNSLDPANVEMETRVILENVEVFMIGSLLKLDRMQLGFLPQSGQSELSEITFRLDREGAIALTQFYDSPGAKISLLLRPRQPAAGTPAVGR